MKVKLIGTCCRSFLLIFLVVFSTCSKDDPGNPTGPLKPPTPSRILVTPSSIKLEIVGQTVKLQATVFDHNNNTLSGSNINWYSNNTLVASVNATGLVTARANGSAVITAASGDAKGQATVIVTIADDGPIPTRIAVSPTSVSLTAPGQTTQLTAVVYDQRDRVVDGAAVSWSSGDSAVATVNDEGLVTAISFGGTMVSAKSGNASNDEPIHILVSVPRPTNVSIKFSEPLTAVGQTTQLIAVIEDQAGRVMTGVETIWSSVNRCVALVDDNGLVEVVGMGRGEIELTVGSFVRRITFEITEHLTLSNRDVLIVFHDAMDGPNWMDDTGWLSEQPLNSWFGVKTDQCGRVAQLDLVNNGLTGEISPELGNLHNLISLNLENNAISGTIPEELGNLKALQSLRLGNNPSLTGSIPTSITLLDRLATLTLNETRVCVPVEHEEWLRSLWQATVARCLPSVSESFFYITQAVQSYTHPVPLIANEAALLRVFVAPIDENRSLQSPPVKATFYHNSELVYTTNNPRSFYPIPDIDESRLSASINAIIPGWVIQPGLEVVVVIDPTGGAAGYFGDTGVRIPKVGTKTVEVREVPSFELTVVPFVWTEDSDRSLVEATNGLTGEDELFWMTRELLPVSNQDFNLTVREFLWTSSSPDFHNSDELFRAVEVVRASDGKGGHYMGLLTGGAGGGGIANTPGPLSLVGLDAQNIAHELGHNMYLWHAPCGRSFLPTGLDPDFPTQDGTISNWGFNSLTTDLVPPDTPDLMGYCGPPSWISGYNFTRASEFRSTAYYKQYIQSPPISASARSLLLWGGVDQNGALVLEPSFVIEANPHVPGASGPYRLQGYDASGRVLFTLNFAMGRTCVGSGTFAFLMPVDRTWSRRLVSIQLSGPEGTVTIDNQGVQAMALLVEGQNGPVRGFLRDIQVSPTETLSGRRIVPESGLDAIFSRGIPDPSSW